MNARHTMVAGLCLALAACNGGWLQDNPAPEPGAFASGQFSRITTERFEYIEDRERFEALWDAHSGGETRAPDAAFEYNAVIAVFIGERMSGGYSIEVHNVHLRDDTLHAQLRIVSPGPGCMVTQALTQPWQLVYAPRGATAVEFDIDRRRVPCR